MSKTPEEYQKELMRMYHAAQQTAASAETPSQAPPQSETKTPAIHSTPKSDSKSKSEPAVDGTSTLSQPESAEESTEDFETGWLQVITRSAGNARAIAGVSVLVTGETAGQSHLERIAITDDSGETEKISLPVPPSSLSLDSNETRTPYGTYDVSVFAEGFYRQTGEKVPVFAGTTSRQIFSMIPLPGNLQEPPKTIVYQNTEPNNLQGE